MYQQPQANTSNYTNYSPYNFYLSPNISRKNTQEISTRYSAINPIHQSQFLDEEQVETIITTTSTYNQPNPAKRLHSQSQYISSGSDLIGDIQRANQSICQITNDLKGFNDSIRKRSALMDETRKSTYSFYEGTSITPVSNNNLNADYTFPSPNPRTARSYTNYNQEIPMSVSQNLNAPLRSSQYINTMNKSALNFKESTIREPNPLSLSTFHDGTQTVINFPFCTYNKHEESEVNDTRANYRSTYQSQLPSFQSQLPTQQSKQAEEEDSSRRYYVKHEDLEYEEFEDFTNPENNYKRIKYPYQANWQRVHQIPEFIQSVIDAQKNRSSEPTAQIEQSSPLAFVPQQQQYQQQQAVKQPNYVPKASINLLDDTNCRSYVETNNTLSGSYLNSANNIPFQYY